MALPRFHVEAELAPGRTVELPPAVAHHALRVLRLHDGDAIVLFDGRGGEYRATLMVTGERASASIEHFEAVERESPLAMALVQAWVASDKLDWIVEKAVELGAARIVLWPAERSVVRLHGERRERRLAHLRQVAVAACEQCGRNRVPAVDAAADLDAALVAAGAGRRVMLRPDAERGLARAAADGNGASASVTLVVGPEGGFSEAEVARGRALGCEPATLGPRVLRTETAGLAALAALQATGGDLR